MGGVNLHSHIAERSAGLGVRVSAAPKRNARSACDAAFVDSAPLAKCVRRSVRG